MLFSSLKVFLSIYIYVCVYTHAHIYKDGAGGDRPGHKEPQGLRKGEHFS